jgi:hypothetical protein
MDTLHEVIDERVRAGDLPATKFPGVLHGKEYEAYRAIYDSNYEIVRSDFYRNGCKALTGYSSSHCEPKPSLRTDAMSLFIDVMGDDLDGIASMMEDAEYLGLI